MSYWTWILPIYDRMNKIVELLKSVEFLDIQQTSSSKLRRVIFFELQIDKNKCTKNGQTEVVKYLHSFFEVRIFKNYKKKLQT